ncbi:hypothetical protein B7494_g7810 [Chlorociboria aeruginascens]|nr:hypothetical protein B7494_g7810 [Chlorociboria aeruginascens]
MSDGKGKGRACDNRADRDDPPNDSVVSRVTASASGLAYSAFTAPHSNELNNRALTNAGKGQSSAETGISAWVEGSTASSQRAIHNASASGAFRSVQNQEDARQAEGEFSSFLDGIDTFQPSEDFGQNESARISKQALEDSWARSQPASIPSVPQARYATVAEQQGHDGEDVLAMLSQPDGMNDFFEPLREEEEIYDWGLSAEQLSQLRVMTKDCFPPAEPHLSVAYDHPLNLMPSFESLGINRNKGDPLLSNHTVEPWRDQWEDVLTRYTDEVWGGLLPFVKEARREIEEMGHDSGIEKPKALRRLELILGHIRKH